MQAIITFWDKQMSEDVPGNQLQGFSEKQGTKPQLDWVELPDPFDWILLQPKGYSDITMGTIFGK